MENLPGLQEVLTQLRIGEFLERNALVERQASRHGGGLAQNHEDWFHGAGKGAKAESVLRLIRRRFCVGRGLMCDSVLGKREEEFAFFGFSPAHQPVLALLIRMG